jgi:hypothetical protein
MPFLQDQEIAVIWLLPTICFGLSFSLFAYLPIYSGIPLALGVFFLQYHVCVSERGCDVRDPARMFRYIVCR